MAFALPIAGGFVVIAGGHGAGVGFMVYWMAPDILFGSAIAPFKFAAICTGWMAVAILGVLLLRGRRRIARLILAEAICVVAFAACLILGCDDRYRTTALVTAVPSIATSMGAIVFSGLRLLRITGG